MKKEKRSQISVQGTSIGILSGERGDYISLTDMIRASGDDHLIYQWMRNRNTLEFLGIWEQLHNPDFKGIEFDTFRAQAGLNSFTLTPRKWIEATGAIGFESRAGRGGGTYAHRDIAFEFGTWLSPVFKLYLIKEFQRLKEEEAERQSLTWSLNRALSKLNYRIHTDAIKDHLIPESLTKRQEGFVYADEADLLNVALFGKTAKQWRDTNPEKDGNMRDYATAAQLLVMVNLESLNAQLVRYGLEQPERLRRLREAAVTQLKSLSSISLGSIEKPPNLPLGDEEDE